MIILLNALFREHKLLDDAECLQKAGNKPATEKQCSLGKLCPLWHTGSWKGVCFDRIIIQFA